MSYRLKDPPEIFSDEASLPEPTRTCACGAKLAQYNFSGVLLGPTRCDSCLEADEEARLEQDAAEEAAGLAQEVEQQARPEPIEGLPSSLQGQRFEDYLCPPGDRNAGDMARQWVSREFPRLCLYGATGVGKTLLAAAAADAARYEPMTAGAWYERLRGPRHSHDTHAADDRVGQMLAALAEKEAARASRIVRRLERHWRAGGVPPRRVDVIFTSVTRLLHELRLRIDRNESVSEELDRLMKVEVLILDDLGAERPTAWTTEQLEFVLDQRGTEGRRTLITTNLTRGEIARYYQDERRSTGHRIASRLSDFTRVHVKAAGDFRVTRAR